MKKSIAVVVLTWALGLLAGFTPAVQAEPCNPITSSTTFCAFTGEICLEKAPQTVHITGALTTKANTYQVEALGVVTVKKSDGRVIYSISGSETVINPRASIIGSIDIEASGETLTQATTKFANKVMTTRLP